MVADTFTLTIRLGNAAMQSSLDVAEALRKVAERVEGLEEEALEAGESGGIMDLNGNKVGSWKVE